MCIICMIFYYRVHVILRNLRIRDEFRHFSVYDNLTWSQTDAHRPSYL